MALPAVMKTTAARLSALFLILFTLCAGVLVAYMSSLSVRMLTEQTQQAIVAEMQSLDGAYSRGGLPMLVRVVEVRSRQPGANLYLIADPNGRILSGNVESLEPGVLEVEGWTARPFAYRRYGEAVRRALGTLGFDGVEGVRQGKVIELDLAETAPMLMGVDEAGHDDGVAKGIDLRVWPATPASVRRIDLDNPAVLNDDSRLRQLISPTRYEMIGFDQDRFSAGHDIPVDARHLL